MEASEATRRVFWRHRWLLIALLLIPVALVAPWRLMQPVTYAATSNVQAQAQAPDADTQVLAILSRVTAVATSPSVVQQAINAVGVNRNAVFVARHDITATSLSSSAVVAITVTDPDRAVAISLSRSLANGIVKVLNGLGTQSSSQLASLGRQRTQLKATQHSLVKQLAQAQAAREPSTDAGVEALLTQLTAVENQITANLSAAQQILSSSSANQGAGVISGPAYATSQSRHVAVDAVLAGLLGLIIGLLIATIRELARPTLAEPAAGARELSLVLLGAAELRKEELTAIDDDLPARLDLAAHRLGACTLVLTGPVPPAALKTLAAHLDGKLPAITDAPREGGPTLGARRVSGITALADHVSPMASDSRSNGTIGPHAGPHALGAGHDALAVTALPEITLQARPKDPALVLVLPRFAPRAALDQAVDLGLTTGWPILGVVGLQQRRRRRRRGKVSVPATRTVAVQKPAAAAATGSPAADSDADEHLGSAI